MSRVRASLTYANVMSTLAVFLVLAGGSAYAAGQLAKDSVGAKQLKRNAVTADKIRPGAVTASAIRAGAVTGPKIGGGAVGGGQLADGAVTGPKIANGAVGPAQLSDRYLSADAPGLPVAGANVLADGTLGRWFNRAGGAPTVTKQGTGQYRVSFPGLDGKFYVGDSIAMVSLTNTVPGFVSRISDAGVPVVRTYTAAGLQADLAFDLVLVTPGSP